MDGIDSLQKNVLNLEENFEMIYKKLRASPKGSIQVLEGMDYPRLSWQYWEDGKLIRKGIKRRTDMVLALIRKAYYQEYIRRIRNNILVLKGAMKKMLPTDVDSILLALPSKYLKLWQEYNVPWEPSLMHPVFDNSVDIREFTKFIPEEERDKWAARPYRANTDHMEHLQHKTPEGFLMRSKGEMGIFDIYKRLKIATHYDEIFSFGGTIIKSPDFVFVRPDGKLIVHEHCGRVGDKDYMWRFEEKLELYNDFGIVSWDNLIITYETVDGAIDLALAEAEIRAKMGLSHWI